MYVLSSSVVDPDSLDLDPDAEFKWILIQGFDYQKLEKEIPTSGKQIYFDKKLQFTYP